MESGRHNFNTKKVRLKLIAAEVEYDDVDGFQYQKGAIKTKVIASFMMHPRLFQYQKGAIKTTIPNFS